MRAWTWLIVLALPVSAAAQGPSDAPAEAAAAVAATFSGVDRQLAVRPPRLDVEVVIDGVLDEPAWEKARSWSASRSTRRWTAARRATPPRCWSGTRRPRSTSACGPRRRRARCGPPSPIATASTPTTHVEIFLDTFHDGRQAIVFGVNPFGVQADGALVEGVRAGGGGFDGLAQGREDADLSPDFVFDSRGRADRRRATRSRSASRSRACATSRATSQTWGLQRHAPGPALGPRGHVGAGAPAAAASFLAQAGDARRAARTCAAAWCSTSTP